METRVYDRKLDISEEHLKGFWNKRAEKYDGENPYVSIKLGDKDPSRARRWDEYEKNHIIPLLNINNGDKVLDIGCGIGRLAEAIIPVCNYYLGTDYAEELIAIAKKRVVFPKKEYVFKTIAMQDISSGNPKMPVDVKYSVVLIAGVMGSVNDDTVRQSLQNMMSVLQDSCKIYIANGVGISQRLTLNRFYSEDLQSEYSSVIRTEEEYLELFSILDSNDFKIVKQDDLTVETVDNSETKRMFQIYER